MPLSNGVITDWGSARSQGHVTGSVTTSGASHLYSFPEGMSGHCVRGAGLDAFTVVGKLTDIQFGETKRPQFRWGSGGLEGDRIPIITDEPLQLCAVATILVTELCVPLAGRVLQLEDLFGDIESRFGTFARLCIDARAPDAVT